MKGHFERCRQDLGKPTKDSAGPRATDWGAISHLRLEGAGGGEQRLHPRKGGCRQRLPDSWGGDAETSFPSAPHLLQASSHSSQKPQGKDASPASQPPGALRWGRRLGGTGKRGALYSPTSSDTVEIPQGPKSLKSNSHESFL